MCVRVCARVCPHLTFSPHLPPCNFIWWRSLFFLWQPKTQGRRLRGMPGQDNRTRLRRPSNTRVGEGERKVRMSCGPHVNVLPLFSCVFSFSFAYRGENGCQCFLPHPLNEDRFFFALSGEECCYEFVMSPCRKGYKKAFYVSQCNDLAWNEWCLHARK